MEVERDGGGFALLVYPMTYLPQYSQVVKTGGLSEHLYVASFLVTVYPRTFMMRFKSDPFHGG